jgi:hypothetical protein
MDRKEERDSGLDWITALPSIVDFWALGTFGLNTG